MSKDSIDTILEEAVAAFRGRDEATKETFSEIQGFVYVLASRLIDDPSLLAIPLLDQTLVYRAISQMIKENLQKDERTLRRLVKDVRFSQSEEGDYVVTASLNVKTRVPESALSIFPDFMKVEQTTFCEVVRRYPGITDQLLSDLMDRGTVEEMKAFEEYANKPVWIIIHLPHSERHLAFRTAFGQFELLRSFLNHVLTYEQSNWLKSNRPICEVGSCMFPFLIEPNHMRSYFNNPDSHFAFASPSKQAWDYVSLVVKEYNALKQNQLKDAIRDAFLQYGVALDVSEPNTTFHLLWSIIESLLGESGKMENRLKGRYALDSLYRRFIIDILHQKRNTLAHRAKLPIQLDDVNHLKRLVDDLLSFAMAKSDVLQDTKGLSRCLDFAFNPSEMEIAKRATESIEKPD